MFFIEKKFSRLPVDFTLEQTINANAAIQRTGIVTITNSISACQNSISVASV